MSATETPKSPFRLVTFAEIRARPLPKVLVPDAISRGDLITVAGPRSFVVALCAILGPDARLVMADNFTLADRAELLKQTDRIRQDDRSGPACIVWFSSADSSLAVWFRPFPDVELLATAPDRAEVVKLRNHPDLGLELVIRDGVAKVEVVW